MYQANYNAELGIASLSKGEQQLTVLTLLQQPGTKKATINAYLGARYSRSTDSVIDVAQEVIDKNIDGAARLERIFNSYGHASVGDMAMLTVCIENVPIITAMRFFYLNPVVAGQEKSTRFVDFTNAKFNAPTGSPELVEAYSTLMQKQLQDYQDLLAETEEALSSYFAIDPKNKDQVAALKARTFDTVRFLLPVGLHTSFAAVMSARSWSTYIGLLRGSSQLVEQELGNMLQTLLVGNEELLALGYVPEADGLIRHTQPNSSQETTTKELLQALSDYEATNLEPVGIALAQPDCEAFDCNIPSWHLLEHLLLLEYPALSPDPVDYSLDEFLESLGEIVFKQHNQYKQIGTLAQSGAIKIQGKTNLGNLKDLNRHRSTEKFYPLLDNAVNLKNELARADGLHFEVCEYLNLTGLFGLRAVYREVLKTTYQQIQAWHTKALEELGEAAAREYTRYLLPHAHSTAYITYGSLDDFQYLINTRVRSGGHINYRKLVRTWAEALAKVDPLWKVFLKHLQLVIPASVQQFLDRS